MSVYIYGLKCPSLGTIRYVGKSDNPERRFKHHIQYAMRKRTNHRTAKWIRHLADLGLVPELVILHEVAEGESWQDLERDYIASATERGWKLTNMIDGGIGHDFLDPVEKAEWGKKLGNSLRRQWADPVIRT